MSERADLDEVTLQQHTEFKQAGDESSPLVFVDTENLRTQLGQELFTWNISRLHEHSEVIAKDVTLCNTFVDIVLASRHVHEDPEQDRITITAASNAISVLNYGSRVGLFPFRFDDVGDWSSIRVPNANLSHAVMPYCNLSDADLSGASMIGITLYYSQLQRANLLGIKQHTKAEFVHVADDLSTAGLTPDGHWVAYSSDPYARSAQIINIETNECMGHLNGFTDSMTVLNFSRDGDYLISAGDNDDATLHVWDMRTYECKAILQLDTASPATTPQHSAAFNLNHRHAATAWKDGFIRIWDIQTSQVLRILHHPSVSHVDWSPKGDQIASRSDSDGRILLWDVETYTQVLTIETHRGVFKNFQFSGDGRHVLFSDHDIYVWDAITGRHKATLQGHTRGVSRIVCDPDGCYAYSCDFTTIRTWNLVTNECLCVVRQDTASIESLALSRDGRNLFSVGHNYSLIATIWNTEALKLSLPPIPDLNGAQPRLSPDGRSLAIAKHGKQVAIYSTETGQLMETVLPRCDDDTVNASPRSLCYSFNGEVLAYLSDDRVHMWDFRVGKYITGFDQDSIAAYRLCFHPSKNLLAVWSIRYVEIWDCETFQRTPLCTQTEIIHWVGFSPDGCTLGIGSQCSIPQRRKASIQLWNIVTKECTVTIDDVYMSPGNVSFSPCGRFIAYRVCCSTLCIASTKSGQCVNRITFNDQYDMGFHPSGQVISPNARQGLISVCDPALRICYTSHIRRRPFVRLPQETSMSQNGRLMALTLSETEIGLWKFPELQWKSEIVWNDYQFEMPATIVAAPPRLKSDQTAADDHNFSIVSGSSVDGDIFVHVNPKVMGIPLKGHSEMVSCMASSRTADHLVSGSYDGSIRVWNLVTYECIQVYEDHTSAVTCVQVSPDGKLIASGSHDTTIRIWSISETKCIHCFEGHASAVKQIVVSPDMNHIASIGALDHVIRIWDMATGVCSMLLDQHIDEVFDIQFSSDGRYLISGSHDDTIRVWETKTGECISTLKGHTDCLTCFVMTSDGKTIVSGADDNTVRVWDVAAGKCRFMLRGHTEYIRSLCLTPDDQCIISTSNDHVIHIWNLVTGKLLHRLYGHTDAITRVKLLHYDAEKQSTLVSMSQDGSMRLWMVHAMPVYVEYVPKLQSIIGRQECINLMGTNVTAAQLDRDVARLFREYGAYSVNRTEVCFAEESFGYDFIPHQEGSVED